MQRVLWPLLELTAALALAVLALRWVLGLFGRRRVVFEVTYWRGVYLLLWPLATLCVGAPFLTSLSAGPVSRWEVALVGGLGFLVLGFALPALLLHAQYYLRNRRTTLEFDPKRNWLAVYENGVRIPFERHTIERVEWATCRSRRLFWSPYQYLRLHLQGGREITLTSLLMNLQPLADFLRNTRLQERRRWLCWL